MQLSDEEDDHNLSLSKFESMLKTNKVLFFDSEEFEEIILHYLDMGKASLAKKALKLALEQHPKSTGLKLVQVEMLVYDDKLDLAEKLLNELFAIEPHNEEIYIQKANIYSKRDEANIKTMLTSGVNAMPKFSFNEDEKEALIQFLKEVDLTGYYPNKEAGIEYNGWVEIKNK